MAQVLVMLNGISRFYTHLLNSLLNGGIETASATPDEARRRRLFNLIMLCSIMLCLMFVIRAVSDEVWLRVISLATSISLNICGMLLLRVGKSTLLAYHVGLSGYFMAAFFGTYSSGGITNVAAGWMYICPLLAGMIGGASLGRFWMWVALSALLLLIGIDAMGVGLVNFTPEPLRYTQDRMHQIGQWLIISVCMLSYLKEVNIFRERVEENISHLEHEVEQRKQAEQKAVQVNRVKSQFLTSMSHELRTPLNAIIGFSERLKRRWGTQPLLKEDKDLIALESIHKNGEALLHFINDLIEVSNLDNGELVLHYHTFSMNDLLQKLQQHFRSEAQAKQLELHFRKVELPLITADIKLLERVFEQLIGNAVKHTQEGQVVIEAVQEKHQESNWLRVMISDTGPGFTPAAVEQIFEPYTPIEQGGHGSLESSGLAMALCQRLIRLHSGEITLDSELGKGSCFTVRLPFCSAKAEARNRGSVSVAGQ